jgi:hypothetical protein
MKELSATKYSVEEARMVVAIHVMDVYYKDLITWLCDRVEELEEQLRIKEN